MTQDMKDNICAKISNGLSLRKICARKTMPCTDTVRKTLLRDKDFVAQYARARDEQADYYADEIVEIADTTKDPAKARLQIDSRKWIASKLKAKKYGDAAHLKLTDGEGNPLQAVIMAAASKTTLDPHDSDENGEN